MRAPSIAPRRADVSLQGRASTRKPVQRAVQLRIVSLGFPALPRWRAPGADSAPGRSVVAPSSGSPGTASAGMFHRRASHAVSSTAFRAAFQFIDIVCETDHRHRSEGRNYFGPAGSLGGISRGAARVGNLYRIPCAADAFFGPGTKGRGGGGHSGNHEPGRARTGFVAIGLVCVVAAMAGAPAKS